MKTRFLFCFFPQVCRSANYHLPGWEYRDTHTQGEQWNQNRLSISLPVLPKLNNHKNELFSAQLLVLESIIWDIYSTTSNHKNNTDFVSISLYIFSQMGDVKNRQIYVYYVCYCLLHILFIWCFIKCSNAMK